MSFLLSSNNQLLGKNLTSARDPDNYAMILALGLARLGLGATWPNPLVGAVVVNNGIIVGVGYHKKYGDKHAEINALEMAGNNAAGATLYVTLEPCNHQGKTPPCTAAIIAANIKKVVFATTDPNPKVIGSGEDALRKAGIETQKGLLEDLAIEQNLSWRHAVEKNSTHLTLKIAISHNGKISDYNSCYRFISSAVSRAQVQRLRACSQAIMVGVNTVIADNPMLTNRSGRGEQPLRIVLDSTLRIPPTANVLKPEKNADQLTTIIFTSEDAEESELRLIALPNVEIIKVPANSNGLNLNEVLSVLYSRGIYSILCEGGAELSKSLLQANLVDRLIIYESPHIIELGLDFLEIGEFQSILADKLNFKDVKAVGSDSFYDYRRK
jgi:diaminohydroxyphosphoribosylaminopyrimidine deaminase/5-amino-6-(5-phosphoribosylamino)uracil reductase